MLKIIIVLSLVTGLILMFVYLEQIKNMIDVFIIWVEKHPFQGSLLIVGAYVICELIFVPGTIMSIGAGFAL